MTLVRVALIPLLILWISITIFGCGSPKDVSLDSLKAASGPYRTWTFPVFSEARKIGVWRSSIPTQWKDRPGGGVGNGSVSISMLILIHTSHRKAAFSEEIVEDEFGRQELFAAKQFRGFTIRGARHILDANRYNLHAYNPTSGLHIAFLIESGSTPWTNDTVLQLLKAVLTGRLENDIQ